MGHHFSAIGLHPQSPDAFRELAVLAAETAMHHDCPSGRYLQWCGASGAELWLQFSPQGEFLDIQPHFHGAAAIRFGVLQRVSRPTDTALDGAWLGMLDPADEDPTHGRCDLLVESPDFGLHHALELPRVVSLQVAAFGQQTSVWATPDEFMESGSPAAVRGLTSLIPGGETARQGGETEPRRAQALLTGFILRCEERLNELSGLPFWWTLVETEGGRFDVLLDPQRLEQPPVAGGILSSVCWISGRVL